MVSNLINKWRKCQHSIKAFMIMAVDILYVRYKCNKLEAQTLIHRNKRPKVSNIKI